MTNGATAARPGMDFAAHYYTRDGKPQHWMPKKDGTGNRSTTIADARKLGLLPSPTTILKQLAKPQLTGWLIEQGCLAVLTSPRKPDESLDQFVYRVLHIDKEHDAERDAAAEAGTAIHEALELAMCGIEYDPAMAGYVVPVMAEINKIGRVATTEKVIVGDGYAGRTDCLLESDDAITVLDFKGCKKLPDKGPWDEHRMQLAAYAAPLGNTGNKRVECANIYINRNEPGDILVAKIDDWQHDYKRFKLLVDFWYLSNRIERSVGI